MSRKPIAVMTSDWHLAHNAWPSRPSIRGDALWGLRQVLDLAVSLDVPILAAGDLLDCKKPKPSLLADIQQVLRTVRTNAGVSGPPIYFVQGQHDLDRLTPWLEVIAPNAEHVDVNRTETTICFQPELTLTGLDWGTQTSVRESLSSLGDPGGEFNILMMHQIYQPFLPVVPVAELYPDWVPDWVDLLLIGDFHESIDEEHENSNGCKFRVLSPGPVSMQRITESASKSVYVLWDDYAVTLQYLQTRPVMDIPELHTPGDFDKFSEQFDDEYHRVVSEASKRLPEDQIKPLVYVRYYEGVIPDAKRRIQSVVGEKGHLFLKTLVEDGLDDQDVEVLDKILERDDLPMLNCLPQVCDPVKERWVFDLLTQLLSSETSDEDPQQLIEEFREKVLEGKLNVENTQVTSK